MCENITFIGKTNDITVKIHFILRKLFIFVFRILDELRSILNIFFFLILAIKSTILFGYVILFQFLTFTIVYITPVLKNKTRLVPRHTKLFKHFINLGILFSDMNKTENFTKKKFFSLISEIRVCKLKINRPETPDSEFSCNVICERIQSRRSDSIKRSEIRIQKIEGQLDSARSVG